MGSKWETGKVGKWESGERGFEDARLVPTISMSGPFDQDGYDVFQRKGRGVRWLGQARLQI